MSVEQPGTEEGSSCADVAQAMLGIAADDTDTANNKLGASKVLCEGMRGCREERPCQMTCSQVFAATTTNSTITTTTTDPTTVPPTTAVTETSDTTAWGNDETANSDNENSPDVDVANNNSTNAETSVIGKSENEASEENVDEIGNRTLMI